MGTVSGSPPCRYMLCEEAAPFRSITHTLLWETEMAWLRLLYHDDQREERTRGGVLKTFG